MMTPYPYDKYCILSVLEETIRDSAITVDLISSNSREGTEEYPARTVVKMAEELSQEEEALLDAIVAAYTPPVELTDLEQIILDGKDEIDEAAGMARARYITVAPGQSAAYTQKAKNAKKHKDNGYPIIYDDVEDDRDNYPYILAEKNAKKYDTHKIATDIILLKEKEWDKVSGYIEEIRVGFKDDLSNADTVAQAETIKYNGIVLLNKI